jgi:hypothetical protein
MADPIALNEAARCFYCIEPGQLDYVKVYLLAVIAGGSLDPQVLLEESRCLECLKPGQLQQVEVYLLNNIANP